MTSSMSPPRQAGKHFTASDVASSVIPGPTTPDEHLMHVAQSGERRKRTHLESEPPADAGDRGTLRRFLVQFRQRFSVQGWQVRGSSGTGVERPGLRLSKEENGVWGSGLYPSDLLT